MPLEKGVKKLLWIYLAISFGLCLLIQFYSDVEIYVFHQNVASLWLSLSIIAFVAGMFLVMILVKYNSRDTVQTISN